MRRCRAGLLLVLLVCSSPAWAAEPAALAKARALYNAGSYDAAIQTAASARSDRQFGPAASLVIGRSHLERYRLSGDPVHLSTARELLATISAATLSPRDQVDLLIGLGQSLFFGEQFGAAAELFDSALARSLPLLPRDRWRLLDWWASALEREAQSRPPDGRRTLFERVRTRMEDELAADASSAVANYWLAAAARGEGDLERAWDAAVAGWVRSTLARETTELLRMDLERLVAQALIPERVRTRPAREQQEMAMMLRVEWDAVKQGWK